MPEWVPSAMHGLIVVVATHRSFDGSALAKRRTCRNSVFRSIPRGGHPDLHIKKGSPGFCEALVWLHREPLGAFKSLRNPFECLEKTQEIFAEWLKAFGALPKALERLPSALEALQKPPKPFCSRIASLWAPSKASETLSNALKRHWRSLQSG